MADGAALLQRIVDAPDDDAARLVYADWLLEQGDDARGELIQLQVKLAAEPDDARRRAMRVAENKLLKAHGAAWLEPLYAVLPQRSWLDQYRFEWVRGFVEEVALSTACLGAPFAALLARAPLVRALTVRPATYDVRASRADEPDLADALAAPEMARLRALALDLPGIGSAATSAIARSPTLRGLTSLSIKSYTPTLPGLGYEAARIVMGGAVAMLAHAPHLAGVTHLALDSNRIGLDGVRALANGPWRLQALDLAYNELPSDGLVAALRGPATAGLVSLRLAGNKLDASAAAALAGATWLGHLQSLDLESCALGGAGMTAFCNAFALPALRRLRVESNSLGDAGGVAVAGCAGFAQLTDFEAGHNRMGQKAGAALASSPHLAGLSRLLLNEPRWKPEVVAAFAASPVLARAKIYMKGKLLKR